jgi:hypothetical protein
MGDSPEDNQPPAITVAEAVAHSPAGSTVASVHRMAELFRPQGTQAAPAGHSSAAASRPASASGFQAQGFRGLDLVDQEKAGTGKYANTQGGLEPPDQALCVGHGVVIEGVNLAFRYFSQTGAPLGAPIPVAQLFNLSPQGLTGSVFVSDPRCIYDAATQRFFLLTLEIDEPVVGVFSRAHNYLAVSKTSDPRDGFNIFSFDVTDDGLNGTPLHLTCPCLGDQPLLGADANGIYLSDNEFSDAEVLPVAPPPAVSGLLNAAFSLPDFRNGQAQVYALSKSKLVSGQLGPVVRFDTASIPTPAGSPSSAIWSSLQPATSPPGDLSGEPAQGVEYFLSSLDFGMSSDHRVAVWAATNTASLTSSQPNLGLTHVVIDTKGTDTYTFPVSADQKDSGSKPLGDSCLPLPCNIEKLNANDDRMNDVMFTNGNLWSGVNTRLAPTDGTSSGPAGDPRTGIMYFEVHPQYSQGTLSASMVRDGYVAYNANNVLFPSIGAAPGGAVVMGFTLSGVNFYPSAAWARLDGLAAGQRPAINISGAGAGSEDGFTGYCDPAGVAPITNIGGLCTNEVSRWGDYSFTAVDEQGCIWTAAEYISGVKSDPVAGNWATYITRISPPGCSEPAITAK